MLQCPRDQTPLDLVTKGDADDKLATCSRCRGAWLEARSVAALCPTAAHLWEHRTEVALQALAARFEDPSSNDGAIGACLACPHKTTQLVVAGMPIDFCTYCGGLWLDGPEADAFLVTPTLEARRGANPFRESATELARDGKIRCASCSARATPRQMLARNDGFYCVRCFYTAEGTAPLEAPPEGDGAPAAALGLTLAQRIVASALAAFQHVASR